MMSSSFPKAYLVWPILNRDESNRKGVSQPHLPTGNMQGRFLSKNVKSCLLDSPDDFPSYVDWLSWFNGLRLSKGHKCVLEDYFRLSRHISEKGLNLSIADFQKLQASFDILKDEYARKVFNHELMIRLKERREQFVESVVEDYCESDVDSFVKRKVAEMQYWWTCVRAGAKGFDEINRLSETGKLEVPMEKAFPITQVWVSVWSKLHGTKHERAK
nr:reticulon-4-interacting protein 1, mitochondrial [Tanacetum cinerariifolium]